MKYENQANYAVEVQEELDQQSQNDNQKITTIHLAIFGKGVVGSALLNQIFKSQESVQRRRRIQLKIIAIANSKKIVIKKDGFTNNWKYEFDNQDTAYSLANLIGFVRKQGFQNLIVVDNTASETFVQNYSLLIEAGFNLVSCNKIANTLSYDFYKSLRKKLKESHKEYLYETNVGAGLPLIDTIRLLHDSGEDITKIRGVFSGTLSYLFNEYSLDDINFSAVLQTAINRGYTEPDPREDLCGNDVARKLVILARELELKNEINDVKVTNLIPEELRSLEVEEFLKSLNSFDEVYQEFKVKQDEHHVLRYVGELGGDLFKEKGELTVNLISVPKDTPLGALKGTDAIFEIYTASYGEQPIVIQGAGAGADVTARGVFGDILRIAKNAKS